MKRILFSLSFAILAYISCYADLYINEVNSTGKWIEIYNSGENNFNAGGYFVVRNNNDGATATIKLPTGTVVAAKGFLVIYQGPASEGSSPSPVEGAIDCMTFGISSEKFMNAVLKDYLGNIIDDSFDIGNPQTVTVDGGKSWAREYDGAATIVALDPTPGKSNIVLPPSKIKIYVNEVNSTGKWIEFYNDEDEAVNMENYTITRSNYDGVSLAKLPAGAHIKSKGFLVIYQGPESGGTSSSPVEGAIDCLTYGISSDRFMNAVLRDEQGSIVDNTFDIGYPQSVTVNGGKSWARDTDGAATIVTLDPTPGKPNSMPLISGLKIFINEVNSTGKWIEFYNDEDEVINIGNFVITRSNYDGFSTATLPEGTIIASKGFLVIYQGTASGGTSSSPVEGAIDCLTYGISSDRFMNAVLKDDQGNIVDNTFDIGYPQTVTVSEGKSWARESDGAETIVALEPTPGLRNNPFTGITSDSPKNILAFVSAGLLHLPEKTSGVQIYSVSGNLVLDRNLTVNSIDLANLPKGFYVVRLKVSGKLYTQKIVL